MYSTQCASVELIICLSFFDWTTGSAICSLVALCFLEFLVPVPLSWLFAERLMVLWVTEVFNLKNPCSVYCVLENLFALADATVNA